VALPWDAPAIATGLRVGDEVLWRVTFRLEAEPVSAKLGDETITLKPDDGGVGMWLRHEAGKRLAIEGATG
jgi:hypothetical protein